MQIYGKKKYYYFFFKRCQGASSLADNALIHSDHVLLPILLNLESFFLQLFHFTHAFLSLEGSPMDILPILMM